MNEELGNYRSSVSVTIEVKLLHEADHKAREEGITRSALFELAVRDYLNKSKEDVE